MLYGVGDVIDVPVTHSKPIPQQSWSAHQWLRWLGEDIDYLARKHNFKPIDWKVVDGCLYFLNHDRRCAVVIGLKINGLNENGYFGDDSPHMELDWVKG